MITAFKHRFARQFITVMVYHYRHCARLITSHYIHVSDAIHPNYEQYVIAELSDLSDKSAAMLVVN